jgi:adenine phosphoribosyltransferase
MKLEKLIRKVPDYPKKGILFYDITPLLKDPKGFSSAVNELAAYCKTLKADIIVAVEARGFIFGAAVAAKLKCGFIPVRKPGKLPYQTISETYQLEYGTDTLTMHVDAVQPGQNVVIVDDLLATGGTVSATAKLIQKAGAKVAGMAFVIELDFLKGREKLTDIPLFSLIHY